MSETGALSHIDISASQPGRSIPFYAAFFTALGYRPFRSDDPAWQGPEPERAAWWKKTSAGIFGVEVRPAQGKRRNERYDRYAPGPHHIAFHAAAPDTVDAVHAAMLAVDAEVLDAPAEYGGKGGYGDAYYAVFFADPDGLKLEVVCVPDNAPV